MLLTIIIPVYNAEKYLLYTINSILSQQYSDYEILLIDDGSTDSSSILCDSLAEQYSCISVFHKPNGGVSSARNTGIENTHGKYITFIDADDVIGDGMLADLIYEIETKQADKIFCAFEEIQENGKTIQRVSDIPNREKLDREFIVSTMLYSGCTTNGYMNSVCGSIFKTSIIVNNKLGFENRPVGEDWLFNMMYCDLAQSIIYINKPYYKYKRNNESAMAKYQPRQFDLWLENRALRQSFIDKYSFKVNNTKIDLEWVSKVMYYSVRVVHCDMNFRLKLKKIFSNPDFRTAIKKGTIKPLYFMPVIWAIRLRLYRLSIYELRIISIII